MTTLDPHTQHRKLAALANFLDDLPHDRFHMPSWSGPGGTDRSCGTAGCACGWAATKFHSEGWWFDSGFPGYEGAFCTDAFAVFFCLGQPDAHLITTDFTAYRDKFQIRFAGDITPRMAATMIRTVLQRVDPAALEPEQVYGAVPA